MPDIWNVISILAPVESQTDPLSLSVFISPISVISGKVLVLLVASCYLLFAFSCSLSCNCRARSNAAPALIC